MPTSSDDWLPFLERTGGLAPDLPGFGRSGKPGYLDYTIEEYDRFLERFLDDRGLERVSLVVHDWGAVGLAFAQRHPERIERLVIVNAVPLLPGYRWHRTARIWRTPLLGELSMGTTFRFTLRRLSRESNVTPGPLPEEWIDSGDRPLRPGHAARDPAAVPQLPAGTAGRGGQPPRRAACAGARRLGTHDPYIPARFGGDYAAALPRRSCRVPGRRPLGMARPPRHDRPRRRLPERRGASHRRAAAPAARSGPPRAPRGR